MMYILKSWRTRVATAVVTCCALVLSVLFALAGNTTAVHAQENSQWVHSFASSQDIEMTSMSLSVIGEVFIAGTFHGTVDFDPGPGDSLLTSGPSDTSFIAKYTPAGALVWAYRLVGSGDVQINDIVVDPMSQIGVVGSFEGTTDLDPGAGVFQVTSKGGHDIFVLRLLTDGNLQWAWADGDGEDDMGLAITTDSRSALYITGKFEGRIYFQAGESPVYEWSSIGGTDVFAARFNNAGTLFWARVFGGDEDDVGTDIDLDGGDNVFVVGTFAGTADLDPLWTSSDTQSNGRDDIFVSVMTQFGESRYQTHVGGTGNESNAKVLVQLDGAFYVSGEFAETIELDTFNNGQNVASQGGRDLFIVRFGPAPGRNFEWGFGIGGAQTESLAGLAMDGFGSVYMLGTFGDRVDFDPSEAAAELTSSGAADIFLVKYAPWGQFRQVQGMINPQDDRASDIAIHTSNNVLIGGEFSGTIDLGSGLSVDSGQPDGVYSVFVARYARDTWTLLPRRAYLPQVQAVIVAR